MVKHNNKKGYPILQTNLITTSPVEVKEGTVLHLLSALISCQLSFVCRAQFRESSFWLVGVTSSQWRCLYFHDHDSSMASEPLERAEWSGGVVKRDRARA